MDFDYKRNKLTVSSNISAAYGKDKLNMDKTIYYPLETWKLTAPLKSSYKFINGKIGIDYEFTSKLKVGAVYYGHATENPFRHDDMLTDIYDVSGNAIQYMNTSRDRKFTSSNNSFNIYSIIQLDTLGKKITLDFDYFKNNNHDSISNYGSGYLIDNSYIDNSFYSNNNNNDGSVTNYSVKIDMELPLKWVRLNFGGQLDYTTNDNDYKFYENLTGTPILDNNQTNRFQYEENVQSVYISGYKQLNNKLSMQLGLRLENTITKGYSETVKQTDKNNYLNLFPSFYLLYWMTDNSSASLSYSRRINRPYFFDLNPFKSYVNNYDYSEGNPFLKPSYSNNLELSVAASSFVHKFWYSYFKDDYARFPLIDAETKVIKHYPDNFINYYSLGLSESYTFNKIWWWNSYNNVVAYYIRKKSKIQEAMPSINRWSGNFKTHNDFLLNKESTMMFNIGFYYELPYLNNFSQIGSNYYFYGGIRMNLLNNKLSMSLTVYDIFKTIRMKETLHSNHIKYVNDNRWDSRYFQFSISYKIGNESLKRNNYRNINEGIKNRVK
jgi:outer membrane receptor protein involved in Fe transport